MTQRTSLRIFPLAAIFFVAAFSSLAQVNRPNFDRAQTCDVQHYILRVSFDRSKKTVNGDATVVLKPLSNNFRSVELDAVDLKFSAVTLEGTDKPLVYRAIGDKVAVTLDRAYAATEEIAVRFKYTAKPAKGIYFVDSGRDRSDQIWTQGEPDEARHWFPSFDFPSDKATTEQYISAQSDETVIGNGEMLGKADNGNGTSTWHFRMPVPHSTYLVSFVVGKFAKAEEKYKDIPLGYYVYPGRESIVKDAYGRTIEMMAFFEEKTGVAYPYNKYDQTIVADFQFGGMENITATTMADSEIFSADSEFGKAGVTDLVSHELAHSWFGNLVTCKNWAELWLNEGFATFMEAAYREKAFGRAAYIAKVRSDALNVLIDDTITRRRHGLYNLRAGDVSSLFDNSSVTYSKGGAVLHILRGQVGDEAFWKGVNIYLNRHKFASVESTDLRRAMEEASDQDLKWFFDQWVYGASIPRISVTKAYDARNKSLRMTFTQTQKADTIVPAVFRLPIEIEITTASGVKTEKVNITQRVQTVRIPVDSKPSDIVFDPAEKIILKSLKQSSMTTIR
ncbi:MAG: M1 family aminopeptidase [Pyrinomonadaceae bacterium]